MTFWFRVKAVFSKKPLPLFPSYVEHRYYRLEAPVGIWYVRICPDGQAGVYLQGGQGVLWETTHPKQTEYLGRAPDLVRGHESLSFKSPSILAVGTDLDLLARENVIRGNDNQKNHLLTFLQNVGIRHNNNIYCIPDILERMFYALPHIIHTITWWQKFCCSPSFADELIQGGKKVSNAHSQPTSLVQVESVCLWPPFWTPNLSTVYTRKFQMYVSFIAFNYLVIQMRELRPRKRKNSLSQSLPLVSRSSELWTWAFLISIQCSWLWPRRPPQEPSSPPGVQQEETCICMYFLAASGSDGLLCWRTLVAVRRCGEEAASGLEWAQKWMGVLRWWPLR